VFSEKSGLSQDTLHKFVEKFILGPGAAQLKMVFDGDYYKITLR
jgi:hypothetical protein